MRKVLLATTALAMMGGVSTAYADIVSGGHEQVPVLEQKDSRLPTTPRSRTVQPTPSRLVSTTLDHSVRSTRITLLTVLASSPRCSISDDWGTISVADMNWVTFITTADITDDEAWDGATFTGAYKPGDEQVAGADVSHVA